MPEPTVTRILATNATGDVIIIERYSDIPAAIVHTFDSAREAVEWYEKAKGARVPEPKRTAILQSATARKGLV